MRWKRKKKNEAGRAEVQEGLASDHRNPLKYTSGQLCAK